MSSFADAIATARSAWLSNYTLGDKRWRLKELHGLHQLVINNRDAIVGALATENSQPTILYEREIAILVKEIHSHISHLEAKSKTQTVHSTHLGEIEVSQQPYGVSLVISNSENFIRLGLAPLAASIAANNVVILATSAEPSNPLMSYLQSQWSRYLDPDSIQLYVSAEVPDFAIDEVDHLVVFDSSASGYSRILQSPDAHFYPIPSGDNFAIIGNGTKNWGNIAREIFSHSTDQQLPSDRLSAVFFLAEDADQLHDTWTALTSGSTSPAATFQISGATPWTGNALHTDISSSNDFQSAPLFNLQTYLEHSQSSRDILFISISSLDQAIDLLNQLSTPVHQLSILAPGLKTATEYVRDWVKAHVLSVGSIPAVTLPLLPNSTSNGPSSAPLPLFPSTLFSQPHLLIHHPPHSLKTLSTSTLPTSTPTIRATYDKLIKPLDPEPRGERVDFFVQVEYLLKGVAAVVGVLGVAGLYVGGRAVRRRWL